MNRTWEEGRISSCLDRRESGTCTYLFCIRVEPTVLGERSEEVLGDGLADEGEDNDVEGEEGDVERALAVGRRVLAGEKALLAIRPGELAVFPAATHWGRRHVRWRLEGRSTR